MRDRRSAIALAVLVVSLVAIALIVRPRAAERAPHDPRHSTFLLGPNGTRAMFLLLEELEVPAVRHLEPWADDRLPDGPLVVLAPLQPPTPSETDALFEWLRGGGTLIWGASPRTDSIAHRLGLRLMPLPRDSIGSTDPARPPGVTARAQPHDWTMGLDSVAGFRRTFSPASPALNEPATAVLLQTETGEPTVVALRIGDGTVVALSDPGVLSNAALRSGDAGVLFVRSTSDAIAAGGAVHFDEYHHGYRAGGGPVAALRRLVATTGWGRALAQAAIAVLALLLLHGARLGRPVIEHAARRRSPLEHVDALAAAYRKAGARRTARRLILAGLDRRLSRRPPPAGTPPVRLRQDVTPAARRLVAEWDDGERGSIVALAGAVDDYVAEVRRWK